MRIVVNHLTRMQPGYICVAGVDLDSDNHVRPVLAGTRLPSALLVREGGPIDIGVVVELGNARPRRNPPEVEDRLFELAQISRIKEMKASKFWELLERVSKTRLRSIFGESLKPNGRGCATDLAKGTASLGCFVPVTRPRIYVDRYSKIRMEVTDPVLKEVDLSVTDLRLFEADHKAPRLETVREVQRRVDRGVKVILGVGLTRPWTKPGDDAQRHWLQVNNLHLEDHPVWQVGPPS